ncbi:MAG: hypothetical protein ACLQGP_02060 [Isosphaeraceae bacterium]
MRNPLALCALAVLLIPSMIQGNQNPNPEAEARRIKRELLSTWDCVSLENLPKETSHIKHITPTHYTWVTYDREQNAIVSVSGGTWSLQDGKYREVCEFASDSHQHVRGKTFTFTMNLVGDKWGHKGVPGTEIPVDEVWNRVKSTKGQEKNTEQPGQKLLGTWETDLGERAPRAMRMVKHITPTHWTWVIYDRENKMVMAAMGGPWSVKGDKYEETVAFTTDNVADARGTSHPYGFQVDGDRWLIKRGPGSRGAAEEVWKRLK